MAQKLAEASKEGSAGEIWGRVSRTVLSPDLPYALHEYVYGLVFEDWDPEQGPPPAWTPTDSDIAASNIAAFAKKVGVASVHDLHQWSADNREAFKADEAGYLDQFPMSDEQREAVLTRDWNGMLRLGGNIYYTSKLAATDGLNFQQLAAIMTGVSQDEYRQMMLDGGRSPEERAVVRSDLEQIEQALTQLPTIYREAVLLRDIEGLTYDEIGAVLGLRLGTVRSRIARGRDRLRALLEVSK